jgi:hypothetical protein
LGSRMIPQQMVDERALDGAERAAHRISPSEDWGHDRESLARGYGRRFRG